MKKILILKSNFFKYLILILELNISFFKNGLLLLINIILFLITDLTIDFAGLSESVRNFHSRSDLVIMTILFLRLLFLSGYYIFTGRRYIVCSFDGDRLFLIVMLRNARVDCFIKNTASSIIIVFTFVSSFFFSHTF